MYNKFRLEFILQIFGIGSSYSEKYHRANVPENSVADFRGNIGYQLSDVLMRDNKIKSVLAGFGKNSGKRVSSEVLELVDIKIKVGAFFFRNSYAFHRGKLYFGYEHCAQQSGLSCPLKR